MNFLKRAGWSLWRHKFKNILLIVVFSAIFAVTLISFMVYSAASRQVEITQKAVANAVTLQGPLVNGYGASSMIDLNSTDAKWFVDSKYVSRYNIVSPYLDLEADGIAPILQPGMEEDYQIYQKALSQEYDGNRLNQWRAGIDANVEKDGRYVLEGYVDEDTGNYRYRFYNPEYSDEENKLFESVYNMMLSNDSMAQFRFQSTAVSDSEYFDAFSSGGFSLVEGEHFRSNEEPGDYILLSQEVAERNGLKVGDTVKLHFSRVTQEVANFYYPQDWEVTLRGIFVPPDTSFSSDGITASNFMFVPYESMMAYIKSMYQSTMLWFPPINRATAYIDDPQQVDAFVEEAYGKFEIVEMSDQTSPPTGTNIEELLSSGSFDTADSERADQMFSAFIGDLFFQRPWYVLMLDRGWYDMVAAPLENVSLVTLSMGVFLLVSAFVVLLLVCILSVRKRKREFGILLSMGENKFRLFLQVFLEQALPLLLAVAVGFAAGVPFASVFGSQLLFGQASETNQIYADDKLTYLEEQLGGNSYGLEDTQAIRSTANVSAQTRLQFRLDGRIAALYFAAAFIMLFLTVLVEMLVLLRLAPARILTRRN